MISYFFYKVTEGPRARNRLRKAGMEEIDVMPGDVFETYVALLFKQLGYRVLQTKHSGDYGADLILHKDSRKIVVQCKRYKSKVSIKSIQEVVGAKAYYHANEAWSVTNSYHTQNAINLASANQVSLIERHQLANLILQANEMNKNKKTTEKE